MSKAAKSTKAEFERRVQTIAELMAQGIRSKRRIVLYVQQQDEKAVFDERARERWGDPWDVTADQIYRYILEATKLFTMSLRSDFDHERALLLEQCETVYTRALADRKYSSATRALREKMYLLGIGQENVNVPGLEELMNRMRLTEDDIEKARHDRAIEFREVKTEDVSGGNGNGHNGKGK